MAVVGIFGENGKGKTLLLTYLLYFFHRQGRKIFANCRLNFPHEVITTKTLTKFENIQNCVVGFDEFEQIFDSHAGLSKAKRDSFYIMLEQRKREIDFFYTSQFIFMAHKTIREQTSDYIECNINNPIGKNSFGYHVVKANGSEFEFILQNPLNTFKLYDTRERMIGRV